MAAGVLDGRWSAWRASESPTQRHWRHQVQGARVAQWTPAEVVERRRRRCRRNSLAKGSLWRRLNLRRPPTMKINDYMVSCFFRHRPSPVTIPLKFPPPNIFMPSPTVGRALSNGVNVAEAATTCLRQHVLPSLSFSSPPFHFPSFPSLLFSSHPPPLGSICSGVTRLQWAHVQVFQKGPLFPQKNFKKTASGKFWAPHSAGPACTARLARPIVTPLEVGPLNPAIWDLREGCKIPSMAGQPS